MKIILTMAAFYPYGQAYASRVLNMCRLLTAMGHQVVVFCDYLSNKEMRFEKNIAKHEEVEIRYLTEDRGFLDKLTVMYRTPNHLRKYLVANHVDLIVVSSSPNRFRYIQSIAKQKKIPLILETCEKYHPSNWSLGKVDPRCRQFECCWKKLYPKSDGVIAISRFLHRHFSEKGMPAIRIPTILDVTNTPFRLTRKEDSRINLVFAGGLGSGKDSLSELIEAMHDLMSWGLRKPFLNVYGPSEQSVKKTMGANATLIDEMRHNIMFHGRIPQQEIASALMQNDFGVILRPRRESSQAGFPTKLAEYMQVGLPVLANDTGDIGLYIKNGENGILIVDKQTESIKKALKIILSLNDNELLSMRKAARLTAEENFDYRKYQEQMTKLIHLVMHNLKSRGNE